MDTVRQHLVALLEGGQAYDTFDSITSGFKPSDRGRIPSGAEHSAWQILEHMRLALRDILDFTQNENGDYAEKAWPEGYWPGAASGDWNETIKAYRADLMEMKSLVKDRKRDLFAPFPWGDGQTLFREAALAADHAAYHLGQLVGLQRWLKS